MSSKFLGKNLVPFARWQSSFSQIIVTRLTLEAKSWSGMALTWCQISPIFYEQYHVRYLSHLAIGSSNQDPLYFKVATLAPKLANPLWTAPPPYFWIWYSWSRLTIILYYIYLSLYEIHLLRNQISLCQHTLYYSSFFIQKIFAQLLCAYNLGL